MIVWKNVENMGEPGSHLREETAASQDFIPVAPGDGLKFNITGHDAGATDLAPAAMAAAVFFPMGVAKSHGCTVHGVNQARPHGPGRRSCAGAGEHKGGGRRGVPASCTDGSLATDVAGKAKSTRRRIA